jgi:hypothetical protein
MDFQRLDAFPTDAAENGAAEDGDFRGAKRTSGLELPKPSRELALQLIRLTLSDPCLLTAVARRSTFHENGFVKIPLTRDNHCSIRLHIWQTTEKHLWAENVHDHRFSFQSCVLAGALEHRPWSRSPRGEIKSCFHYFPASGSSAYRILYCGEEAIAPGEALQIVEGGEYRMNARELHQVRALAPETVTFLVEDRFELDSFATVFSERYDRQIASIKPAILNEADCLALLERTLARITPHAHRVR